MPSRNHATADPRNATLLAHLGRGGTVLTAGRREARHLRRLFDTAQLEAGREVWPTADVMPLAAWLAARWAELAASDASLPTLLDESQAVWPWRARVAEAAAGSLLAVHDLASAARAAWISLRRHGGALDLIDGHAVTRDQRMFRGWAKRVEADLAASGWLDPGLLEVALAAQADRLGRRYDLLLAANVRHTPALEQLLGSLSRLGHAVAIAPPAAAARDTRLYAAHDPSDEVQALANWLRKRLLADPAASLAAIVPDVAARRAAFERQLESVLQPELEWPGAQPRDRIFDIAGGVPLAGLGVAAAAMDCLETCRGAFDARLPGRLLLSRYVETRDSESLRVRLELRLRQTGVARWEAGPLATLAREASCPGFAQALAASAIGRTQPRRRSSEQWAQVFGDVLAAWRWPGETALATDEFQAAQALRERLSQFAALARTAPLMERDEALAEFGRLAQGPHQPERGDPAVLVFDRLEPPGMGFDGLWIAGLGAPAWPRAATPDPFLPVRLQDQLGLPGATAARCLDEAIATTAAWLGTATEVVFSWPMQQDDARVDRSRVLPQGLESIAAITRMPDHAAALFSAGGTEVLAADPAPPLAAAAATGGTRILQYQSQCPFRAFAELRLGAKPLEQPRAGVDARQRGAVLHRALDLLWGELGGRAGLDGPEDRLRQLTCRCVERALAERLPAGTGRRLWELERDWQRAAVMRELDLERERGGFEVIAREEPVRRQLAGLPLRIVPDRADRLPDGSVLLIDYKTGDPKVGHWEGRRPEQPQLPLYAVLLGDEVSGIAFAAVAARRARFIGIGRDPASLPGLKAAESFRADGRKKSNHAWEQVRQGWAGTLAALAVAHLAGEAAVDPKAPSSCRYCHLETLCRVAGELPEAEEGDDG